MPPESARIIELRHRLASEPGSIAFAQLAEEYRRAGNYEAAVHTCTSGLQRHPAYLSARVTLGRALIELGKLEEAQAELQTVLRTAPDNLAAIRGLAEIHQRRGDLQPALDYYRRALPLARHDPELEEAVSQIKRELGAAPGAPAAKGLSFAQAESELLSALSRMPEAARPAPGAPSSPPPPQPDTTPAIPPASPDLALQPEQQAIDDSNPPALPVLPALPALSERPRAEVSERPRVEGSERQRVEESEGPRVEGSRQHEPDPPAPPVAPADGPIDFDQLLQSLGVPLAPAPPIVEALLSEPSTVAPRPEPVLPDLPLQPVADDPFADLERGLREFDLVRPPTLETTESAPVEPSPPQDQAQEVEPRVEARESPRVEWSEPPQVEGSEPDRVEATELQTQVEGMSRELVEGPPEEPSSPDVSEAAVLDVLEAWLAALDADRAAIEGTRPPLDPDRLR